MFSSPCFRTALGCSKRLKVSSPFRPLSTTAPRLSENEGSPNFADEKNIPEMPARPETDVQSEPPQPQPESTSSQPTAPEPPTMNMTRKTPDQPKEWRERLEALNDGTRLPRSVQAIYLKPLKRDHQYGLPVCDLQLRSYYTRNVEFFADFALRAAYYLGLPASGPVPLPRITERWTVIKSPFIYKKTQENFERITLRRLVQIKDGHPDAVQTWLAFLRRHAFHGVGMKANVYENAPLDFVSRMDETAKDLDKALEPELARFGAAKNAKQRESISEFLETERYSNKGMPLTEVRKQ